ncbi:BCCT family transporter [Actinopolymorpha sp. B11F2]|uniref:BCCT family transporter n=1 Tax=Actinopolymorpha sp. B11F2 TaxID=3160862 RepID=UPI0032E3AC7E
MSDQQESNAEPEPERTHQPEGDGPPPTVTSPPPITDWVVFGISAAVSVAVVAWGVRGTGSLARAANASLTWLVDNLAWFFVVTATGFVVFSVWLAVSRYGRIPLGQDGEKPEFRTISWVAMMFSAGMGIGLMFFGVSEPLTHFVETPPDARPGAGTAMATTLFHWTLHPWAIYAVVGLALAYGTFRKGRPQLISAAFAPLLGERRATGPAGRVIDILAIFATLFGSAASLGLGALQIGAGLVELGWLGTAGSLVLGSLIAVLTVAFVASAVSGVAKGIQWLSNTNMVLAILLAVFVFVVGPVAFVLNLVPAAVGDYFRDFAAMSARTPAGGDDVTRWLTTWTIFYWAWWISWAPFVGTFIARISRGRSIRQFVLGVLAVPSLVSVAWFAIFGGAAIDAQRGGRDIAGVADPEGQLFALLGTFPLAGVTSTLVVILVAIFFVSGADAASLVLGTLSQRGTHRPQRWAVVFWGVLVGAVAFVMLLLGGEKALSGLETLTILAGAPFAVIMVGLCVALARDLRDDPVIVADRRFRRRLRHQVAREAGTRPADDADHRPTTEDE